ncbi:L-ribulose-5-phosphate 3-epimerase [Atopobacter phocae]|uniref:L-ribulose-5-phosphate 3-epimerase n=1 Tax=Atopobacter phocae TaxID=136492 RepID=UPI00046EAAE6|nr:L-ribulose-5-phosphate 3-epimerase [Atopobacter phocae]
MSLIGLYEKATPKNITWKERLMFAKELGFDFVEISVDETDERLSRLNWTKEERWEVRQAIQETGIPLLSMCLSGHRRYPFGSPDEAVRQKALDIMQAAIDLASDLGIRTIQLAGYDVYYTEKSVATREQFIHQLKQAVQMAAAKGVVLAIEIMDDPFMSSITKFNQIKAQIPSPYLQVYPDLGNLSAWPENNPALELEQGIESIVQVHLKDTLAVTPTFEGKFKNVDFGAGCVDFRGLLMTLKRLEYNGPFVVEMWSETLDEPIPAIEAAKDFLWPMLKEAGYIND